MVNNSGNIVKEYAYDEYGVETNLDKEDTNPFRYCGDYFDSIDAAVTDMAAQYYSVTEYILFELGTLVYAETDSNGNLRYSYVKPIVGEPHSVRPDDALDSVPATAQVVASVHTHIYGFDFSSDDKVYAKYRNLPLYVVTPDHAVKVYENSGDKQIYGNEFWRTRTVAENLIIRKLSIAQKISLFYYYKTMWRDHLDDPNDPFGCKDRHWPNTSDDDHDVSWDVSAEHEELHGYLSEQLGFIVDKRR